MSRLRRLLPVLVFDPSGVEQMDEILEATDLRSPKDFEISHVFTRFPVELLRESHELHLRFPVRKKEVAHYAAPDLAIDIPAGINSSPSG